MAGLLDAFLLLSLKGLNFGQTARLRPLNKMSRPTTLPEPWRSLAEKLGGVQALADRLGITTRTINRWANGQMGMSGTARKLFEALCQGCGIDAT